MAEGATKMSRWKTGQTQMYREIFRNTNNNKTNKHAERQTDRQTDKLTNDCMLTFPAAVTVGAAAGWKHERGDDAGD